MKYYAAVSEGGHSEATHAVLSDAWRIKRFNGYYDKRNREEKILQFCTLMTQGYLASTDLAFCGSSWLSAFFPSVSMKDSELIPLGPFRCRRGYFITRLRLSVHR